MELNIIFEELSEESSVAIIAFGYLQARFDSLTLIFQGQTWEI